MTTTRLKVETTAAETGELTAHRTEKESHCVRKLVIPLSISSQRAPEPTSCGGSPRRRVAASYVSTPSAHVSTRLSYTRCS